MKNNIFTFLSLTCFLTVVIVFFTTYSETGTYAVYASSGASPGGKTGSPTDGVNCNQCHSGALNPSNATRTITSTGLSGGYVPGQTYTINAAITGTSSNKIGFEVTVESNATNAKTGTIIITDPTRTKTVNAGKAVTHNSAAGSAATSGANAWTFDWTAPVSGTGAVTFYGNFNATNSNGSTSGDQVYTATFVVNENVSVGLTENTIASNLKLYPNPAVSNFSIETSLVIEKIEIFNLSGQKILEQNLPQNNIDIKSIEAGIYLVKIYVGNELIIKKLIKE